MDDSFFKKAQVRRVIRYILFGFLLLFSLLAIDIQPEIIDADALTTLGYRQQTAFVEALRMALGTVQFVHILAAVLLIIIYRKTVLQKTSFSLTACITGGIFSLILLVGMSFSNYRDFSFLIANKYQVMLACILFIGYWGILYACIKLLIQYLDSHAFLRNQPFSAHRNAFLTWVDTHFFAFCAILFFVCWLPYWIVYFPGSVPYDSWEQLDMFYGITLLTRHHPLADTYMMGILVRLGEMIAGTNLGVAFCVAVQYIAGALVYGNVCSYVRKKGAPRAVVVCCVLFYTVVPLAGTYAQAVFKSSIYAVFFTWFALEYVRFVLEDGKDGAAWRIARLCISGILVCLFRNEGIYIVIPSLLILFFLVHIRRGVCIALAGALVFGVGLNILLLNALEIPPESTAASMSIPFSQMAHYVEEYGEELTEEEQEIIDAIIDYDHLVENYDPELADNVKAIYRKNATDEDWQAFWKLWAEKFAEHPVVYLEATVNHMFGYLDPFYFYSDKPAFHLYNQNGFFEGDNIYSTYMGSSTLRAIMEQYVLLWMQVPLLSLFINCGSYTCAGILILALFIRKKRVRMAFTLIVPALNVLICFVSPVNGYVRYALPVMMCMPLYVFLLLHAYSDSASVSPSINSSNS